MTVFRFVNGHVLTPDAELKGATITVEEQRIVAVEPMSDGPDAIDLDGGWLMPGFIDVQVNGGGGVLFNDAPTVEGIAAIGRAHARYGTTGFLPTLISDVPDVIAQALDATDAAIEAGVPGCIGVHIEGPIINPSRKGIHDPARFRRLDETLIEMLTRPRRGKLLLTLAPEMVSVDEIAWLHEAGVVLSIGHSDADYETATAAIAAGMTGVTHLFNAMSPFQHRAPGVVGAALDDQSVWCGLIVDGWHVHDAALRVALRSRPTDRFMLVTDAMSNVGVETDHFMLHGRRIIVADGRCVGEDGTLAGSALDMTAAVRGAVTRLGVSPATAATMAAGSPAAFLGLSETRGTIAPGRTADWAWLTRDLMPAGCWIGGERVD